MARQVEQVGFNVDFTKNIIKGAARILIADPTVKPFPTSINDIVRTATTSQDEAQTITITGTPAGGTFTLTYKGYTTSALAYNAAASDVVAALVLLPSIGTGGVTGSGGALPGTPVVITFAAQNGGMNVPQMTATSSLTGGTTPAIAVTTTTAGFGQWDAQSGWIDMGPTKGGITIERGNAEEALSVDQIYADLVTFPTDWTCNVSANLSFGDLATLQYIWEGGVITVDGGTGERTLPIGAPTSYRHRRLAVLYQRQSFDGGFSAGGVQAYCFRDTTRSAATSQMVFNKTGDQANPAFTWRAFPDPNVAELNNRFGAVIDQAAA